MNFGSLPFHIGPRSAPGNEPLPNTLPFSAGVRLDCDLLVQLPDKYVTANLEKAYDLGTIVGTPMSELGIGRKYADDFLEFILKQVGKTHKERISILEIGCGYGYLLYRLKLLGFDVLGVDPRGVGQDGSTKYGVKIVQDIFPGRSDHFNKKKYDVIIHHAVMEHAEDPLAFLRAQIDCLHESGRILFSVPDCSDYIGVGDISIFLHEHWSYFTPFSLNKVVEQAGAKLVHLEKAGYGGAMYGVVIRVGKSTDVSQGPEHTKQFRNKVERTLARMRDFFQKARKHNMTVGIFGPGRAINFLYLLKPKLDLRFFDDDDYLRGKYFPPFNICVESRETLISNKVDLLLIMSRTFGEDIKDSILAEEKSKEMEIVLFEELLDY
jgi:2-polyprenyl-3-methyl-5-hydroxy-6-metoxy-1,4-benzoquinol methylase